MTGERLAAALLVLLVACSGDGDGADFALDGSPRRADDEGVVTAVDLDSVTLDGERTYNVERGLVSFSSLDLSTVPLLYTQGQYVQVGLEGDTVRWIGAIASPLATDPPRVVYVGDIEAVDGAEVVFDDGLVLRLGSGVDVEPGDDVQVWIDAESGLVTEVEEQ